VTQSNTSELLEAACGKTGTVTNLVEKFRANRFWSAGETAERNPPGGGNQHFIRRPMDLNCLKVVALQVSEVLAALLVVIAILFVYLYQPESLHILFLMK
jgi:hypothetical protein